MIINRRIEVVPEAAGVSLAGCRSVAGLAGQCFLTFFRRFFDRRGRQPTGGAARRQGKGNPGDHVFLQLNERGIAGGRRQLLAGLVRCHHALPPRYFSAGLSGLGQAFP